MYMYIVVFNTICISFQVKRRKKQFNPSETSCEEEDDKMEEGQGSEVTEPHPQNNNNNSPNVSDLISFDCRGSPFK